MSNPVFQIHELLPDSDAPAAQQQVSLSLNSGDVLGVLGINTDVKSSWCRAMALVDPVASGELVLDGNPVTDLNKAQWQALRVTVNYLNMNTALMSVLSVMDNILLPCSFHKHGNRLQLIEEAQALLSRMELNRPEIIDSLPAYLSTFDYQAAILIRSLLMKPRLLVIDYGFLNVTRLQRQRLIEFALSVCAEQGGVLILHAQEDVLTLEKATHVLYVDDEMTCYYDSVAAFRHSPHNVGIGYSEPLPTP